MTKLQDHKTRATVQLCPWRDGCSERLDAFSLVFKEGWLIVEIIPETFVRFCCVIIIIIVALY